MVFERNSADTLFWYLLWAWHGDIRIMYKGGVKKFKIGVNVKDVKCEKTESCRLNM